MVTRISEKSFFYHKKVVEIVYWPLFFTLLAKSYDMRQIQQFCMILNFGLLVVLIEYYATKNSYNWRFCSHVCQSITFLKIFRNLYRFRKWQNYQTSKLIKWTCFNSNAEYHVLIRITTPRSESNSYSHALWFFVSLWRKIL